MGLKLSHLETFYWISRLGTFHAAARRLNLTQPTLSVRVRGLERALGVTLFEREGRLMRLTADGRTLLGDAERVIALTERIEHRLGQRHPLHGLLRLGVPDSFAMICLGDLLEDLESEYPQLEIQLSVDTSARLVAFLEAGQLDLAFFMDAEVGPKIRVYRLGTLRLAWMASPNLDLSKRSIRPRDLVLLRVITSPHPGQLFLVVKEWFASDGLEPERLCTCNNLNVIAQLTVSGVGVSVLPEPIVRAELKRRSLRILPIRPAVAKSVVFVGYGASHSDQDFEALIASARRVMASKRYLEPTRAPGVA